MLRSIYLYSRYFLSTAFSRKNIYLRKDLKRYYFSGNRYFQHREIDPKQRKLAIAHSIRWLCRAQEAMVDEGIGSYHLVKGWSTSYPETSGYIIPTLLQYASGVNDKNISAVAIKTADWLLEIQKPSGGWQGGRIKDNRPEIVFNTAQIIRGMIAVYKLTKEDKYLDSAIRAGDWLCSMQNDDGTWTQKALMGKARTYDSYVDLPLLLLHSETGAEKYLHYAKKNLDWIVNKKQHKNGWFEDCDNTTKRNSKPILHTIAYTIDGLLDCGIYLNERKYVEAAKKAADILKEKFDKDGFLHGRFDKNWTGSEHMILTGCAQISIIWNKIAHYSGNNEYAETAMKMNKLLMSLQRRDIKQDNNNTMGAISGSYPLWGRYEPFAYPNWATKYYADALMMEENHLK